jgi:hypothetical protein
MNSHPDHSVINSKMYRGIAFLKAPPHQHDGQHFCERVWERLWLSSMQCGVSSVGLREPHATLALWLGWLQCYYGMWTLTLITQSSIVRCTGGFSSSTLHLTSKMGSILWKCLREVVIAISAVLVLVLWDYVPPCNFGFVACLDPALLWYMNSDHDHSVIDSKMYDGIVSPQSSSSPARWAAIWQGVMILQLPSVQCWC